MSVSYTYNPNWINRDSQPDGSTLRVVKAADFEAEWIAIQNAFSQCAPTANPTLTGTVNVTGDLAATGAISGSNVNAADWDTAFGWGDHGAVGYLTAVDAPTTDGTGATGTWAIDISGNAAGADNAINATFANDATNCTRSVTAGTNLSGGGDLTADRTISMVAEPSLTSVVLGNFKIYDSGTNLYFSYNGNNVLRLSSAGELLAENNVGAYVSV
jgi:hypothetical protein